MELVTILKEPHPLPGFPAAVVAEGGFWPAAGGAVSNRSHYTDIAVLKLLVDKEIDICSWVSYFNAGVMKTDVFVEIFVST